MKIHRYDKWALQCAAVAGLVALPFYAILYLILFKL